MFVVGFTNAVLFQMYEEAETVAGRLRHPLPTSTDDRDGVCENFLYVFEHALIRERQREGIELAKSRGVYRGSQKRLSAARVTELRRRSESGKEKAALAREFGISRQSVYRYLHATEVAGSGHAS
jgi:hypothetical protein